MKVLAFIPRENLLGVSMSNMGVSILYFVDLEQSVRVFSSRVRGPV
jgi:hypothetical protein